MARAREPVLANIPLAFTAGSKTLPAGEYRVEKWTNSALLLIQGTDASAATFVVSNATAANEPDARSKWVFRRYGNRYFLSQVWVAGHSRGMELQKSPKEKQVALAARNETPAQPGSPLSFV